MNGRTARALRQRAIVNPKEKTINKKLLKKLKKEYKPNGKV